MLIVAIHHAGGHRNNPDSNANDLAHYANDTLARRDAMKLSGFIILHPVTSLATPYLFECKFEVRIEDRDSS